MRAVTSSRSGAIIMNFTTCLKQVEEQWRQQLIVIIEPKLGYLKCVHLKNIKDTQLSKQWSRMCSIIGIGDGSHSTLLQNDIQILGVSFKYLATQGNNG